MNIKFIKIFILSGLLFTALNSLAQTDTAFLSRAVNLLDKDVTANPIEKVYLHTDRDSYLPGDTIWFKAYTVIGQKHELSALSGTLYVKLLGAKDSILQSITLNIVAGITWGDIALPLTLKTGAYHLIAYTNWMRNAGNDYFFYKQIVVNDISNTSPQKKQSLAGKPAVQFFPEGGDLVNGLRSKVAVKCVNEKGLGQDIRGTIIDNNGTEVADIKTQHLGMGIFALTPEPGKTYKANLLTTDGKALTVDLPSVKDDGFTISVNNGRPDSLTIRVVSSNKLFDTKKNAGYYILAQSGGKLYYAAGFKLSAQSFNAIIDKKRFPTGIARFTLFADNGEPLNERIVFIQHNDTLKLSIGVTGKTFAPREKMKIDLATKNISSNSVTGSFSVSVINENFAPVNDLAQSTIINNLLLTSDIKGHIEQPNYYFNMANDKTAADLDILMLTQGYHRYEWKQVLAGDDQATPCFESEKSLQISGYVKNLAGKPLAGSKVSLLTTTGGFFMLDTITNQNGRFTFNLIPDETLKYVIQASTGKDKKNVMVALDTLSNYKALAFVSVPAAVDTLTLYQKQVEQQLKASLDKRVIRIKEVVIREKKEPIKDMFIHADNPDEVINDFPKDDTGETMSSFLSVRLRNIQVYVNRDNTISFYTYREIAKEQPPKPMLIKLDGQVIGSSLYSDLRLTNIESAEVIRTTGKMDMTSGVKEMIYFISRRIPAGYKPPITNVINYQSNGFYKAKEFYSPRYDMLNESSAKPDLRTTIYWNPNLIIDKAPTEFEFFNADTKGTYRVTVEGIDADGNLGRVVYRYYVE